MAHGLREIEKSHVNEARLMGLNARLGELEDRLAVSAEIKHAKLMKDMGAVQKSKKT